MEMVGLSEEIRETFAYLVHSWLHSSVIPGSEDRRGVLSELVKGSTCIEMGLDGRVELPLSCNHRGGWKAE